MTIIKQLGNLGPGILVSAAFIGPGTVTVCTLSGANFGYALLWSLLFATVATIVLQEMSARLGTVTGYGLGEILHQELQNSIFKWPLFGLIILALYLGNSAYEAGNLAGAALGISVIGGESTGIYQLSVAALAIFATIVLYKGSYHQIEKILLALVLSMGVAFIATFLAVRPDLLSVAKGILTPSIPEGSLLTVIALIGTTVVPYNLFLHASAAKKKWAPSGDLAAARSDTILSIGLGGIITILVASTAAASLFMQGLKVENAVDMANQFEPLFGSFSRYLLGVGLFAAGLSSAIAAPLATGYAMTELLKLKGGSESGIFRFVSLTVVFFGAGCALLDIKPITIILSAQFANGILLPFMVAFLLFAMNRKSLLATKANGAVANGLGGIVFLVTTALGLRMILTVTSHS